MSNKKQKLEQKQVKLQSELRKVRDELEGIRTNEILPGLKERYEGKMFAFRNSYSCPKEESDFWMCYYFITEVVDEYFFRGWSFQTDSEGKTEIQINDRISSSLLTNPIKASEFNAAYLKVFRKLPLPRKG